MVPTAGRDAEFRTWRGNHDRVFAQPTPIHSIRNGESNRKEFFYFTETVFHGMRFGAWKLLFIDQEEWFRAEQNPLSTPILINLKLDPFERFIEARGYDEWSENRSWILGQAGKIIARFVESFQEYPPSQKGMSVQVTNLSEKINSMPGSR